MEGRFNFWSIALLVGISQGVILVIMIAFGKVRDPLATTLLLGLIGCILVVNFDYFLMGSALYKFMPAAIGISTGFMYAFGPLFYLYMRAIADPAFAWKNMYWLHFLPLLMNLIFNLGFYLLEGHIKIAIVDNFLLGKNPASGLFFYTVLLLQLGHLVTYLLIANRFLASQRASDVHRIQMSRRLRWLRSLFFSNVVFVVSFVAWFVISAVRSNFLPPIDYASTLICSAMVFQVAFRVVLDPEVVSPGFELKYGNPLSEEEREQSLKKLRELMENDQMYTEPDLKLSEVADQLTITPHTLSRIINEKFGKSFIDFVNEYRVDDFKRRAAMPGNEKVSLLSIALESGFNSKSAFNAAFRKIAGETPSAFRRRSGSQVPKHTGT